MPERPRVRLIHWKESEAGSLIEAMSKAGYEVDYSQQLGTLAHLRKSPPGVAVIDLTRLPAHGREVAVALRGSKKTRRVPIVFLDGDPDKVKAIRLLIPDAIYAKRSGLKAALKQALSSAPREPVVPPQMMDRYKLRTTAQKLGINEGARVAVIDPPAAYAQAIGALPPGASFEEDPDENCPITLWFIHGPLELQEALRRMRKMAGHTRVWALWRKGKRDGIDENLIRDGALALGLVDYKVCSVNETWSALALAIKKAR